MKAFQPEDFQILVIDRTEADFQPKISILENAGYKIATLKKAGYTNAMLVSESQALEIVRGTKPDLIIFNLTTSQVNELQIGLFLQKRLELAHIPIVYLTTAHRQKELLDTFVEGFVDYICEPFHAIELLTCIKTHLKLKPYREQRYKAYLALEKLVNTDPLTAIANRRALLMVGEKEFSRAQRYERPFSVLAIDIDFFKGINDTYGHDVGDRVLVTLTKTILTYLRKGDCLGRWGGEEFLIFLPETNEYPAIQVAERIRKKISRTPIPISIQGQSVKITLSIGIATYRSVDENLEIILKRADLALYEAKNCGRNQIVFSVQVEQSPLKLISYRDDGSTEFNL